MLKFELNNNFQGVVALAIICGHYQLEVIIIHSLIIVIIIMAMP